MHATNHHVNRKACKQKLPDLGTVSETLRLDKSKFSQNRREHFPILAMREEASCGNW